MVVCKFFQQGNCRYGQNCRFEHVYGSKYTYHSSAPAQAPGSATDEQLVQQVHTDVQAALQGGQWLLSCYAPFKEKPAFPSINDLSFEEARLFIYEARANNNVEQAVTYMNSLFKEARAKYEQLLLKNSNITRVLRSLFSGENVAFSFSNISHDSSSFNNNTASSMFRNAVQPSSIFSQNNTPFGQNNATSIFAQNTTSDPARSIFAQANQSQSSVQNLNAFGIQDQNNQMNVQSNVFGPQTDSTAKSIFAQASHNNFTAPTQNASNAASLFASAAQSAFNQPQSSPFSNNQAQSSNIFQRQETQNPASGFTMSQNVAQQANTDDIIVYSKMEDLSTDDIEAYNCADFKMGFVPELPPPHSLCF